MPILVLSCVYRMPLSEDGRYFYSSFHWNLLYSISICSILAIPLLYYTFSLSLSFKLSIYLSVQFCQLPPLCLALHLASCFSRLCLWLCFFHPISKFTLATPLGQDRSSCTCALIRSSNFGTVFAGCWNLHLVCACEFTVCQIILRKFALRVRHLGATLPYLHGTCGQLEQIYVGWVVSGSASSYSWQWRPCCCGDWHCCSRGWSLMVMHCCNFCCPFLSL